MATEVELTPDQLERRKRIWHECLGNMPPDERDRIREDPTGPNAFTLGMTVEFLAMGEEMDCQGRSWEEIGKEHCERFPPPKA